MLDAIEGFLVVEEEYKSPIRCPSVIQVVYQVSYRRDVLIVQPPGREANLRVADEIGDGGIEALCDALP